MLAAREPEPPIDSWVLPYSDRYTLIEKMITIWTDEGAVIADLSDNPLTSAIASGSRRRYHSPTVRELRDVRQAGWADLVIADHSSGSEWPLPELFTACRRQMAPTGFCLLTMADVSLLRLGRSRLADAAATAGVGCHRSGVGED